MGLGLNDGMRGTMLRDRLRISGAVAAGIVAASIVCAMNAAAAQTPPFADPPGGIEKARAIIVEGERQWVESVVTGKIDKVSEILGTDLVGVSSDGVVYDRATLLAELQEAPKYFSANVLNKVDVRFFGTTAVAQGDETFERREGEPKRARFVFTDTWVYRDGAWKVVATAAIMAPEASK